MPAHPTSIVVAASLLLSVAACKGETSQAAPKAAETGAASATAATELEAVLNAYEAIRGALANDKLNDVAAFAKALESAAKGAASASAPNKGHLTAIESAASGLAGMPTTDADALRKAFGEVSQHVVALVEAEPSLKSGRHLFECPMAQGYSKWVQTSDQIANPYMGQSMPACGGAVAWSSKEAGR